MKNPTTIKNQMHFQFKFSHETQKRNHRKKTEKWDQTLGMKYRMAASKHEEEQLNVDEKENTNS